MPFPTLNVPSVAESVVEHVENMILDGVISAGTKLPSERRLAEALNVSRTSLREALAKLGAKGIIEFDGRNAVIASVFDIMISGMRDDLFDAPVEDLVEFWITLNAATARLASQRITSNDVRTLEAVVIGLRDDIERGKPALIAKRLETWVQSLSAAGYNFVLQQVIATYLAAFEDIIMKVATRLSVDRLLASQTEARLSDLHEAIKEGRSAQTAELTNALWGSLALAEYAGEDGSFVRKTRANTKINPAEQAFQLISAYLAQGHHNPGEILPSVEDLAKQFDVSVNAMRLALYRLEALYTVEIDKHGSVHLISDEPPNPSRPLIELMQKRRRAKEAVFEFRLILEEEAASYAALRRSKQDVQMLKGRMLELEEALTINSDIYSDKDMALHTSVAAIAQNQAIAQTLGILTRFFRAFTLGWLKLHESYTGNIVPVHEQHIAILRAIEAGDSNGARHAMRAHLQYVIDMMRLFEDTQAREKLALMRQELET